MSLFIPPPDKPATWLNVAVRTLTALVTATSALPAGLTADPAALDAYLRTAPESHATTLLRQGLIPLQPLTE